MRPASVRITGWGMYAPERVLTNADLERLVDTSDEWIVSRTGIRERRVAAPHESTATLAAVAGKRAIAVAGLEPDDIDLILVATLTPDYWMPSTAALVKEAIGNSRAAAMDVMAACSGFVYAYATADAYIRSGMYRNVLVCGAELLTRFLDFTDRNTCILFGDGAGAVVVSGSTEEGGGMSGLELTTDPDGAYMIWLPSGGSRSPASPETIRRGEHFVRMEGKETYRYATKTLATSALKAIERAGWTLDEIDLVIPHQANVRIIESVAKRPRDPHGQDVRERRPLRQHVGGLGRHRPRRGGRLRAHQGRRSDRPGRLRGRLHVRRRGPRVDRRSAPRPPRRGGRTDRQRPGAARLGFGRPDAAAPDGRPRGRAARAPRRRRPGRARPRAQGGPRMIDLTGKSAVVTGGSRGIGRAIGLRLARQGADVCFSYRGNAPAAESTAAEITALGRRALAVQGDASDPAAAEALVKAALEAYGKVDILVNNAGITRDDLIMRMSLDAWRDVLETNLFGAFYAIKAVTRPMLKARSGRIVNITSVSGQAGQTGQANYSSAKAGLIGLTKATARELASRGITCNAVAPGFVLTELTKDLAEPLQAEITARTPLGRFGTTEEIADAVAFLVSDEAAFITGQVLAVDGGLVMM